MNAATYKGDTMEGDDWYFLLNGKQNGPVEKVKLQELLSSGQLSQTTPVWSPELPAWKRAHEVLGLWQVPTEARLGAAPPATHPQPGPDTSPAVRIGILIAVLLSIGPLITMIIGGVLFFAAAHQFATISLPGPTVVSVTPPPEPRIWHVEPASAILGASIVAGSVVGALCLFCLCLKEHSTRLTVQRLGISVAVAMASAAIADFCLPSMAPMFGVSLVPAKRVFLWRASNGSNALYLTGSIHILRPEFYPLPVCIEDAFFKSSVLVSEIDQTRISPRGVLKSLLQQGFFDWRDNLRNHIWARTEHELDRYLARQPSKSALLQMRPWLASFAIQSPSSDQLKKDNDGQLQPTELHPDSGNDLKNYGYDPHYGIDAHFADEAKSTRKMTDQLESLEYQLRLFSELDDKLQDQMLLASLLDANQGTHEELKSLEKIEKAWQDGDANAMEAIVMSLEKEHPELSGIAEKFWYKRNSNMSEKIERYLLDYGQSYFIVVGAGHLVGKQGIVQLLRDKGYKVEQVAIPASVQFKS